MKKRNTGGRPRKDTVSVTVRLPGQLAHQLRTVAAITGVSISRIAADAIARALNPQKDKPPTVSELAVNQFHAFGPK